MSIVIYRNSADRTVNLDAPVEPIEGTFAVHVFDGVEVFETTDITHSDDTYSFVLPLGLTGNDKKYKVTYSFDYTENSVVRTFSNDTYIKIVTPILPLSEIMEIIESDNKDDAIAIEKAVRTIVQSYTGQSFGRYDGVQKAVGRGDRVLALPYRAMSIRSVNGDAAWNISNTIHANKLFLVKRSINGPGSIKADFEGYTSGVPISAYPQGLYNYANYTDYYIDGVWGWNSVPEQVQEAAKLLVNDYACGDNLYRDRFVQSSTGADWRLVFHNGAFTDTGNIRANQLLDSFKVRRGWDVV